MRTGLPDRTSWRLASRAVSARASGDTKGSSSKSTCGLTANEPVHTAVTAAILATGMAQAEVTEADIANDQASTGDALTNGMGRHLQRHFLLHILNRDNGKHLVPAWVVSMGGEKQRGQEAQPIVQDGVMYVSGTLFVKDISRPSGLDEKGRPIFVEENRSGNPAGAADGKKGGVIFASSSFLGGKNWMPMAFSQRTGNFFVPSNEWAMDIGNEPISWKKRAAYLGACFAIKPNYEDHIGC